MQLKKVIQGTDVQDNSVQLAIAFMSAYTCIKKELSQNSANNK